MAKSTIEERTWPLPWIQKARRSREFHSFVDPCDALLLHVLDAFHRQDRNLYTGDEARVSISRKEDWEERISSLCDTYALHERNFSFAAWTRQGRASEVHDQHSFECLFQNVAMVRFTMNFFISRSIRILPKHRRDL